MRLIFKQRSHDINLWPENLKSIFCHNINKWRIYTLKFRVDNLKNREKTGNIFQVKIHALQIRIVAKLENVFWVYLSILKLWTIEHQVRLSCINEPYLEVKRTIKKFNLWKRVWNYKFWVLIRENLTYIALMYVEFAWSDLKHSWITLDLI